NGGEEHKCRRIAGTILEVFGQGPTPVEPGERAFHDPAFRQGHKAFLLITAGDNFYLEVSTHRGERLAKLRSLIGAIRKQLCSERKPLAERGEKQNPSIAILNIGRVPDRV